jgi:AraC-like DNA-binding protein
VLPDPDPCLALRIKGNELSDVLIYGPHNGTKVFIPKKTETFIAAKFRVEWLAPILGIPPQEVQNCIGTLGEFDKTLAGRFRKTLHGSDHPAETMPKLILELHKLCEEAGATKRNAGLIQRAGALFRDEPGALPTGAIAGDLDVSPRHLLRVFRNEMELSPNAFKRYLRFLEALYRGDKTEQPDWAGIAIDAGYFDQSHMIRDFKALCGLTPKAVYEERLTLTV